MMSQLVRVKGPNKTHRAYKDGLLNLMVTLLEHQLELTTIRAKKKA